MDVHNAYTSVIYAWFYSVVSRLWVSYKKNDTLSSPIDFIITQSAESTFLHTTKHTVMVFGILRSTIERMAKTFRMLKKESRKHSITWKFQFKNPKRTKLTFLESFTVCRKILYIELMWQQRFELEEHWCKAWIFFQCKFHDT